MPLPAKAFKNKTPSESAEIANAKLKSLQKRSAAKIEEATAEAEQKAGSAKAQGFAQAGVHLGADATMEAVFEYSATAAKYELWATVPTAIATGLGAAFLDGYASSALLGVATAAGGRVTRKLTRMAVSG